MTLDFFYVIINQIGEFYPNAGRINMGEYMILKILSVILLLYLVPMLVGQGVSRILKIDTTIVKNFLIGNIFIWALFQLVTVPLVLMKQSFLIVVTIVNIVTLVICLWVLFDEIIKKKCENIKLHVWTSKLTAYKMADVFALLVMFGAIGWLLYKVISLQHTDADDSRFVVNAVEIVRTNRMFLTDLITGQELSTWIGEIIKDVTSPWAVYIAYYAKMTGISAVILAHSVLPVSLILCAMSVFWLISKEIFKDDITNRSIFMCFVILLNVYGYYSIYSAETFMLTRIWQGKATVASVAIPAMFLLCMWLYENEKSYGYYVLVALLDIGMCLMSGMGLIIGVVMLGSFGLVYGLLKKKLWISLVMWAMCIPNAVYFVINEMQPEIWTLE